MRIEEVYEYMQKIKEEINKIKGLHFEQFQKVGLIFAFIVYIGFTWIFISRLGTILYLNSDTACETMYHLATLEQETIVPDGWWGGSALHVNAIVLHIVTIAIGENYVFAWNIMNLIITTLLFVVIVFFTKTIFGNNSWVMIIPILFSTLFPQMTRLYVFYAGYTIGMILLLLFIIFFVKSVNCDGKIEKKWCFILAMMVLFFACLIGSQGIQMITFPVLGTIFLSIFRESYKVKRRNVLNLLEENRIQRMIGIATLVIGVSALGLMLYNTVIRREFGVNGLSKLFRFKTFEDIKNLGNLTLQSVFSWIGKNGNSKVLLDEKIRICFRVFGSFVLLIIVPVASFIKEHLERKTTRVDKKMDSEKFFECIAVLSFLEIMMIFLFSKSYTAGHQVRYFANPFFLIACNSINKIFERVTKEKEAKEKIYRCIIVIIIAVTIVVNSSGMYITRRDFENRYKELLKIGLFLENNGLTYGFSSYWNASVNTMVTNDKVRILNLHLNGRTIEVQRWYTCDKWYKTDYYKGKSFLLLTDTEYQNEYWYSFATEICGQPIEELNYDGKHIFVYDYNIAEVLPPIQQYDY